MLVVKGFWDVVIGQDEAFFFFLNNKLGEISGMQYLLGWTTFFGDGYLLLPLTALFLWIWDRERWWKAFLVLLLGCLISGAICQVMKVSFARPRPYSRFFVPLMSGDVNMHILFHRFSSQAFPSGHMATIGAVVVGLNLIYNQRLRWLYLLIPWIGLTRIYVGAHYPLDVVAGVLVGLLGNLIARGVSKLLRKAPKAWS